MIGKTGRHFKTTVCQMERVIKTVLRKPLFVFIILVIFLFLIPRHLSSQDLLTQTTGFKFIKNYTAEEHNWYDQNWSILQDKRGCIFIGNHGAVLEFDGVSWRRIVISNRYVRSLAMDQKTGRIYVGGKNEFGFLAPDPDGKGILEYRSLVHHLKEDKRIFNLVLRTYSLETGIYFHAKQALFRWHNGQLEIVAETDSEHQFRGSYSCRGQLYLRQDLVGLVKVAGKKLVPVPGGEKFAKKKIYMLTPYTGQKILIGTRGHGFFIYDHRDPSTPFKPFKTQADNYLAKRELNYGIRLKSGDFALATLSGGVVIIDTAGKVKTLFTKDNPLLDNVIRYLFEDSGGNLWIAQDNGISKIELSSPILIYDDRSGLDGIVKSLTRHGPQKSLYAATTRGLFRMSPSGKFLCIPGMTQQCNDLLSTGDSLMAATKEGVFMVKDNRYHKIITAHSNVLCRSSFDKRRIWVGTKKGLVSLYLTSGQSPDWIQEFWFDQIKGDIRTIVEDTDRGLWLGTQVNEAIKLAFPQSGSMENPLIFQYTGPGERKHENIGVFSAGGHIIFTTDRGFYRAGKETGRMVPDSTFGEQFADGSRGVFRIKEDLNNNAWIHSEFQNFKAELQPDGKYTLITKPFLRIPRDQVNAFYPDPVQNAVWLAGNNGIVRFHTTQKKNYRREFRTLIRKVLVNGDPMFEGYQPERLSPSRLSQTIVEYKDRNITFHFAAPFFEGEEMNRYQTFLEGHDDNWTEPGTETRKDYIKLDPGSYIFRVKAENIYNAAGQEAVFHFKILPPWYKTWWAYSIYIAAFLMIMFSIVKWRSGKLEREKKRLEHIVKERTAEIEKKNLQLEAQTLQLKEQSEKLTEMDKVKTRFFANISHEFRTPLTLIMGPLEEMIDRTANQENQLNHQRKLRLMLRNSRRLLNLINQLLELSKIESGKMVLEPSVQNMIPFLKGIVASFEPVTHNNDLDIEFLSQEDEIIACFDTVKMEDVVFNILSNAVKFTPPGGKISVSVKRNPPVKEKFPSGFILLSIRDTGPGIPRDQLERVFDRFYQSDGTYEHHRKGSGIGLTIAKELVELHNGKIDVHSLEGKGTEFSIQLPLPTQPAQAGVTSTPEQDGKKTTRPAIDKKIMMIHSPGSEETTESQKPPPEPGEQESPQKNIILVVEDSADTRAYIRSSLEPVYKVLEAENGKEGIQKALEVIPDLIVSDIMMPQTDGYELCRELKNHVGTSHIPIILLTAKAGEEDVLEGLETGADDYITKPFNTKILGARIKNLIDQRSHLQKALDHDMTHHHEKVPMSRIDKEFIKSLKEVIKKNIQDPDFNIELLCEKMNMSQPTLYRKIHALSGESPTDFIRSYRLKRGARLLEEKFGSIIEVALEVGFSSAAYFTRCFKKKFNCLPSEYIERNKTASH